MASIEVRGKQKHIYVHFRYSCRQMQEPTLYFCDKNGEKNCKCRGCNSAREFAGEINRKIKERSFVLSDFFPESKALKHFGLVNVEENISFEQYAWQWLDLKKPIIAYSSYKCYKKQVRNILKLLQLQLKDIRPIHIRNIVKTMSENGKSPKTIKCTIFMMHNIFLQATEDKLITENPCIGIKTPKGVKNEPDPFDMDEVYLILNDLEKHSPRMVLFFAIGFFTGMRTGEIMALTWGDIDFKKHTINVNKTCTEGKLKLSTKTNVSHKVDIITELDRYLLKHKEYTFLSNEELFINQYHKPFRSYNSIVDYWRPCLQRLGLAYRTPYQMRHTFACLMLGLGKDPNWVKNMLGHKNLSMLFNTYGNWYRPDKNGGRISLTVTNLLPNPKPTFVSI
jgi:integrase